MFQRSLAGSILLEDMIYFVENKGGICAQNMLVTLYKMKVGNEYDER
jgi:hypothetical protein